MKLKLLWKFVGFSERDKERFVEYLTLEGLSKATVDCYIATVRLFFDEGYTVTSKDFERYKKDQLQKCKASTYNLRSKALNKYFKFKKIQYKFKPVAQTDQNFIEKEMTPEDFNQMTEGLLKDKNYRWYTVFRALAGTGCRISEFRQLTLKDVERGYKDIIGKGTKIRRIWIPSSTKEDVLKVYNKPGYLIPEDMSDREVRTIFKRIADKYGVDRTKIHPHEFRHFYAKQYYEKTHDIHKLKELLGHSSIQTTTRYLKVTHDVLSDEVSSIIDW